MVIRYNYGEENEKHLDFTTINDSCGRTTTYHFYGYSGGYDDDNQSGCYKYGLTRQKYTTDSSGQVEEAVVYTWDELDNALSPVGYLVANACNDTATYVPVLIEQTIYRGGTVLFFSDPDNWGVSNPKDTYTTRYRDFDAYANPETTKEYDNVPPFESSTALKTITQTYFSNTNLNIVKDKPTTIRIQGNTSFPGDFTTSYTYDTYGNLLTENRFGVNTTHTYYSNRNLASTKDANNHTTSYGWTNGAINSINNSVYSISRSINWDGTVDSETNGRGYTTSHTYTSGMRISRSTPPIGNSTNFTYSFGSNSYIQETRGTFSSRIYYDGLGRGSSTWDSIGKTTSTTYKSCGVKSSTSSNIGDTVSFDNYGRITTVTHQDATQIRYTHYSDKHVEIIDEANKRSHQYYATFGSPGEKLLTSVKDANNSTATYSYNVLGNLLSSSFGIPSVSRTFYYNSKNFLYRETHPESGTTNYTFDNVGNLKTRDDGLTTKSYTYDAIDRLLSITAGIEILSYNYDDADNLTLLSSPDASLTYQYDAANRITGSTTTTLGQSNSLAFSYDNNDNLATILYPSGKTVSYGYNTLNQITGISGFGSTVSSVGYYTTGTSLGLLHNFSFGNGQTTTLTYNNRRAMTGTASGAINLGFTYGDNRGNMTGLTNNLDHNKDKSFTYDNISRLNAFNGPWGSGDFNYDADGDRSSKTMASTINYSYVSNRMASATGTSYAYNSDGDMISGGDFSFEYSPFHRIRQVSDSSGIISSFGFDGNGQRVYKTANNKTTIYIRDFKGRLLSELDSSGTFYDDYIYLGENMVARGGEPDPLSDLDDDGLSYAEEGINGTDPYNPDTDNDGVIDGTEVQQGTNPLNSDTDNDELSDGDEAQRGTDPLLFDTDDDGLSDGTEVQLETDPLLYDTDDDGLSDGYEIQIGTNPLFTDTDNDGLSDGDEILVNTDPLNPDTDGDGILDGVDPAPLMDQTWMIPVIYFPFLINGQ